MYKRRTKRFEKKRKEKELLALARKYHETSFSSVRPLEYKEINPIRTGFTRTFYLRKDLLGRPDYKYLEEALNICNITEFNKNRKFPINKKKYHRSWFSKIWHSKFELRDITDKEYNKLSERAKNYFIKIEKVNWSGGVYNVWHPIIPSWMLSIKISPYYIRYIKIFDNVAISEYHKIANKINVNNLWCKIDHLAGISSDKDSWTAPKSHKIAKIIDKEAKKEIEDYIYNKRGIYE